MKWLQIISEIFILTAMITLFQLGGLGNYVTQMGFAALAVTIILMLFSKKLEESSWGTYFLVGVGIVFFYFGSQIRSTLKFSITALDVTIPLTTQSQTSLVFLAVLILAAIGVLVLNSDIVESVSH